MDSYLSFWRAGSNTPYDKNLKAFLKDEDFEASAKAKYKMLWSL